MSREVGIMTFAEWINTSGSEHSDIESFKQRMEIGDAGNPDNKWIAASYAYNAGIQEGLRLAAERMRTVIIDGRPRE